MDEEACRVRDTSSWMRRLRELKADSRPLVRSPARLLARAIVPAHPLLFGRACPYLFRGLSAESLSHGFESKHRKFSRFGLTCPHGA